MLITHDLLILIIGAGILALIYPAILFCVYTAYKNNHCTKSTYDNNRLACLMITLGIIIVTTITVIVVSIDARKTQQYEASVALSPEVKVLTDSEADTKDVTYINQELELCTAKTFNVEGYEVLRKRTIKCKVIPNYIVSDIIRKHR